MQSFSEGCEAYVDENTGEARLDEGERYDEQRYLAYTKTRNRVLRNAYAVSAQNENEAETMVVYDLEYP